MRDLTPRAARCDACGRCEAVVECLGAMAGAQKPPGGVHRAAGRDPPLGPHSASRIAREPLCALYPDPPRRG